MSSRHSSAAHFGPEKPVLHAPQAVGELASWGVRVCAKIIDSGVIWVPFTALWSVGMYLDAMGSGRLGLLFYILSCIEGVLGWGWIIYRTGTTGQSIGKRVMRTRLGHANTGLPIGFGHAFLHETLQLFVDLLPLCIGYLRPLADKEKRQTFSDKILHTQTFRDVPTSRI